MSLANGTRKIRRSDLSHALVHLTKRRARTPFNFKREATAFEVLKEILHARKIEAGHGYVKGSQPVACLSEIPLSALHGFAARPTAEAPFPKYEFYGIAISKHNGFRLGARPVLYLPDAEAGWIPAPRNGGMCGLSMVRWTGHTSVSGDVLTTSRYSTSGST